MITHPGVGRALVLMFNAVANFAAMIALVCVLMIAADRYLPLDKEKPPAAPPGACA